jgi:hypothetical protein
LRSKHVVTTFLDIARLFFLLSSSLPFDGICAVVGVASGMSDGGKARKGDNEVLSET